MGTFAPRWRLFLIKTLMLALSLSVAAAGLTLAPQDAQAKRLGAGKPAGMQRAAPPANNAATPPAAPAQQAAPTAPPATPAAAPATPKRNWLGPIAGIAAGLGLAALFSHFGMGEGMGNILTMVLMAGLAFFAIRWLMGRFAASRGGQTAGGMQFAGAGASAGAGAGAAAAAAAGGSMPPAASFPAATPLARSEPTLQPVAAPALPPGVDAADFERLAKMVFIRLQAANDSGNVDDLRKFTTPELFASLRVDLQERGGVAQQTDVMQLEARIVDTAIEAGQNIVSVRFSGLIREAAEAGAEPFNELWHLVRPVDASRDWAIAGITPVAA